MIDVKDAKYGTQAGTFPVADTDDVGGTSVAPNIHLIVPVNDQFAWGLTPIQTSVQKLNFLITT